MKSKKRDNNLDKRLKRMRKDIGKPIVVHVGLLDENNAEIFGVQCFEEEKSSKSTEKEDKKQSYIG